MALRQNTLPSLFSVDPDYSEYLKENESFLIQNPNINTKDFPVIFAKGDKSLLDQDCISIVGTREASENGKILAGKVSEFLVSKNIVVVSGLALGIDTIAHTTALKNNGKTIAVLGTPIHKIYPKENIFLGKEIQKSGLMISPGLPDETFGKWIFPRRNRLMSLISRITIIIEAGEKSGTIHQAMECLRLGKKLIISHLVEKKNPKWFLDIKEKSFVFHNKKELDFLISHELKSVHSIR